MNGIEMLVNALLKAVGFQRSQLDETLARAKTEIIRADKRFDALEMNVGEILAILKKDGKEITDTPSSDIPPLSSISTNQGTNHESL